MKYIVNLIKYYYYMYKVRQLVPYDGIMESGRLTCYSAFNALADSLMEDSIYLRIDRVSNNRYYYRYIGDTPDDDVSLEEISYLVWEFISDYNSVKWSYVKDEIEAMMPLDCKIKDKDNNWVPLSFDWKKLK